MPKPTTKRELIELSQANFKKLLELASSYSAEEVEKEFSCETLNRNVKDVLAHLHCWHLFMLNWYKEGMNGEKPQMPAEGYTWKTLPELNRKIREDNKDLEFVKVKKLLEDSFKQVQTIIEDHSNEELFEKKKYKWTGTTSLGAYLIMNTASHYNWAIKLIKKGEIKKDTSNLLR